MARQGSGVNVVLLVVLPSLYILGAVVALLQFQVIFTLIVQGTLRARKVPALEQLVPFFTNISDHLIRVFGQPAKFVPQPTHVLLVALLLAVIVHLERRH